MAKSSSKHPDDAAADPASQRRESVRAFKASVNMTPRMLERWLQTPESKEVGWAATPESESVGHRSGRRIIDLLQTRQADLSDDDLNHMSKVVGYVHRHMAQRPDGDVRDTRWRYSLMNWGHDPLRAERRVR